MKGFNTEKSTCPEELFKFDKGSYVCIDSRPCFAREHGDYGRCGCLSRRYDYHAPDGAHKSRITKYESGECPFYKSR